jgi:hypothetical protein
LASYFRFKSPTFGSNATLGAKPSSVINPGVFIMEFIRWFPHYLDVIGWLLFILIHVLANTANIKNLRKVVGPPVPDANVFIANSMGEASTGGITAVSVLISAAFVIVQIANQVGAKELSPQTKTYVFRAALYFLFSLVMGLLLKFIIPMRGRTRNVAAEYAVILPFGIQLISFVFGVVSLVIGFYYLMYPSVN